MYNQLMYDMECANDEDDVMFEKRLSEFVDEQQQLIENTEYINTCVKLVQLKFSN